MPCSKFKIKTLNQKFEYVFQTINIVFNWCPGGNYLFKVNNRNTRTRSKTCLKLTIKSPEQHYWRRSGAFFVNFKHIWHLFLVFLLLTLNMQLLAGRRSGVFIVYFQRCFQHPVTPLTTIVPHYIETSQLIYNANQLTGLYMMVKIGR